VELPGLDPTVTDAGDTLHDSIVTGPATVQERFAVPAKPPSSLRVSTSVTCDPTLVVRFDDAAANEKSGGGLNVAVTVCAELIVAVQ
jgi:hypothetical protein